MLVAPQNNSVPGCVASLLWLLLHVVCLPRVAFYVAVGVVAVVAAVVVAAVVAAVVVDALVRVGVCFVHVDFCGPRGRSSFSVGPDFALVNAFNFFLEDCSPRGCR